MNFKRFWTILSARNREFYRDRAGLGWNIIFPFLLVAGFGVIFGSEHRTEYKIGVFPAAVSAPETEDLALPPRLLETRYVQFVGFFDQAQGLEKLAHHKVDLLIELGTAPNSYWVSHDSPKGYFAEKNVQLSDLGSLRTDLKRLEASHSYELDKSCTISTYRHVKEALPVRGIRFEWTEGLHRRTLCYELPVVTCDERIEGK